MDSATSMPDGELAREEKIILCSGFALTFLGIGGSLFILPLVWTKPIICALIMSWYLFVCSDSCRTWIPEKLGLMGKPMDPELQTFEEFRTMLGMKPKGISEDDTNDWDDIEEDPRNSSETFGIDTPSETGKSDWSSIPMSKDPIYVDWIDWIDWTEDSRASASDVIDTASVWDDPSSLLDTCVQPFARQDTSASNTKSQRDPAFARCDQTARSTHTAATIIQQSEPPKSNPENPIETLAMRLKQPPKSHPPKVSHVPRSRMTSRHQSMLTSYMFEKTKQQPADIIVLYIVKGIEYEERMLVRMYKTAPFVLLKNDLRDKDDTVSELAIKNPEGGEFPVFDNDTPLSVSFSSVV
ncbi:hypothetical protein KCU83_g7788, partial [Aureobasidium melanogenum]